MCNVVCVGIERYAPHRRRATVAALLIELEVRLSRP